MANNDGFNSSEMMYPAVTTTSEPPQPMVPAQPYAAPAMAGFGAPPSRGPELIHGTFNQTWLMNCLRRRWLRALFLGSLLALGAAMLLLWLFPLSSSITALVHVQQDVEDLMEDKKNFSQHETEFFQATQASLIKSQFVLQSALSRRDVAQLNAVVKEEPDPISWLQDELQVTFQGENLAIRYDGEEDSQEMKTVVDAVIAAYKQEVLGKNRIRDEELHENLSKLHQSLAKDLQEKIEKYNTLAEDLGGAESEISTAVMNMLINEVRQIQAQIIKKKEMLVEIEVNKEIAEQQARSTTAMESAVAEELDKDPMLANYKAEEFATLQQLRQLKSTSKSGTSATIKRLEAQLANLQQESRQYRMQTEAEIRTAIRAAPNDFLAQVMTEFKLRKGNILAEMQQLDEEYAAKVEEIEAKGSRSGELAMLESEIDQLREIESEMDYKIRTWKIHDSAADELFRVLQPANAIDQINELQRYALAALGGIAAFCATCYGVALIEFRRRRLNGASDMDEGLGLRVLGVLPSVSSRKAMAPGSLLGAQISESIDNVRATLMHDSTSRKRQIVLVTSPATMEGTTTVASHLALSLTRAGRRTLLIDGDIREPALHKLFGMPMEEGLCEVLRTDAEIADVIRPTNTEGLWLLSAGHCDMDAIHALATDQPQPIFEKLREEFDFIIIDGAPVIGLSDSLSLGQHVDGVILTVLRDHSEVRKVYQAMELLRSMGIRLLGSVVNGVPLKADRRIVQLHKSTAKKPRKITATKESKKSKAKASKAPKRKEPAAEAEAPQANDVVVDEPIADVEVDNLDDIHLNDEIDIDFDDLGIDDK